MKKSFLLVFVLLLLLSCQQSPEDVQHGDITFVPMVAKRLSDMNEPRGGHAMVWTGDHILAIGGHTTGFVMSTTAEYFESGRWHTIPTIYPHDTPVALVLKDGEILISGNWYATDVTEIYLDTMEAQWIDTAADNRSYPFLLPVTNDNVWIVGGTYGSYGPGTQNVVDQTKGEPFTVDLLVEWLPQTPTDRNVQADAYRLAEHSFLIPAMNAE